MEKFEFKDVVSRQKFQEIWTHRRNEKTHYHQLHFDSENEGRTMSDGRVCNPLCTFVVYLTDGSEVQNEKVQDDDKKKIGNDEKVVPEKVVPLAPTVITSHERDELIRSDEQGNES